MTQKYVSVFILFLFCFYRVVCQFFCIISQSPSNLPTLRFRILIHVRESRRLLNVSKCMHTTRGGGQIRLGIYSRFFLLFHPSLCVCVGFQVVVRLVTRAPVCVCLESVSFSSMVWNISKVTSSCILFQWIFCRYFFRLTTTTSPSGWTHFISGQRIRSFS